MTVLQILQNVALVLKVASICILVVKWRYPRIKKDYEVSYNRAVIEVSIHHNIVETFKGVNLS